MTTHDRLAISGGGERAGCGRSVARLIGDHRFTAPGESPTCPVCRGMSGDEAAAAWRVFELRKTTRSNWE